MEDTYKLYEMAYFAGDVILELRVYGGRSSVVQLKGALSNPRRAHRPQFFGLDLDPAAMKRSYDSLAAFGVAEHALLYRGGVAEFAWRSSRYSRPWSSSMPNIATKA